MEIREDICRRAATVNFSDGYAPWYKLWIEHNHYHDRIIDVLTTMAEPAGNITPFRGITLLVRRCDCAF